MGNNRKQCIDRDRNTVNNMMLIVKTYIKDQTRPKTFMRTYFKNNYLIGTVLKDVHNKMDNNKKKCVIKSIRELEIKDIYAHDFLRKIRRYQKKYNIKEIKNYKKLQKLFE